MTRSKNTRKRKHGRNPNLQKKPKNHHQSHDPILFGPDSDSDEPANIQKLLESYPKDKLVNFLCDAALADSSLLAKIQSIADRNISHLKVFVHGLSYDTTQENLIETFKPFGPIKECHLVIDKATGRSKGYGFVVFKSWDGASKALKQPKKQIKTRVAFCQLASVGPAPPAVTGPHADTAGRKVYVTKVHADAAPDKLRALFSQFGEIETGPMGFDKKTGKSRGYALFVYKTQEGAKKALAQPYKMFEGHQLHVQRATETNKGKSVMASAEPVLGSAPQPLLGAATQPSLGTASQPLLGAAPQPVLAAVAAAQNLALYSQNPAYATLLGQNPLLAAALNPLAWNPAAMNPTMVNAAALNPMAGTGLGSYGGSPSLLGAYGSQGTGAFQAAQYGQYTLGRPGRPFDGMAS